MTHHLIKVNKQAKMFENPSMSKKVLAQTRSIIIFYIWQNTVTVTFKLWTWVLQVTRYHQGILKSIQTWRRYGLDKKWDWQIDGHRDIKVNPIQPPHTLCWDIIKWFFLQVIGCHNFLQQPLEHPKVDMKYIYFCQKIYS